MYVCVCKAITQKMLQNNSFLISEVGTKCGKCLESGLIFDGERMTHMGNTPPEPKIGMDSYGSGGNFIQKLT